MRLADLITASFLALLGGVVVFDAVRLGIGWGTDGPQSGFFPFWLGVLMITACAAILFQAARRATRSEEHTSELQSLAYLVCRLLLEKKKKEYALYLNRQTSA